MSFLRESDVPPGTATGCILGAIAAMTRKCYYCQDGAYQLFFFFFFSIMKEFAKVFDAELLSL